MWTQQHILFISYLWNRTLIIFCLFTFHLMPFSQNTQVFVMLQSIKAAVWYCDNITLNFEYVILRYIIGLFPMHDLDRGHEVSSCLPGMCQCLATCISLLYIYTHELANKVFGRVTDVIPVRGIKLKLTWKESTHYSYLQICRSIYFWRW